MVEVVLYCIGSFIVGAIVGHRFLPPRIDEQRERMLSDLMAREAARQMKERL